ncbi:hypothetical protein D3C74_466530 [compost metagenome]
MAMFAPINEIRAFAKEDVAKRRVAAIAWARQHHEIAADFPREQHAVAVKRQERIFQANKRLEVLSCGHAD